MPYTRERAEKSMARTAAMDAHRLLRRHLPSRLDLAVLDRVEQEIPGLNIGLVIGIGRVDVPSRGASSMPPGRSGMRSRRGPGRRRPVKVLVIGAGVIGTVYGAELGEAGNAVSVVAHGSRTEAIARSGLSSHEVLTGATAHSAAAVVADLGEDVFDVVLVSVRRDDLASVAAQLRQLRGRPLVVFFGNNPQGTAGLPDGLAGAVSMGFPGVGGTMADDVAQYVRIAQQPTALDDCADTRLGELQSALQSRGFAVQRIADMSGWLAYHAVFVACVSSALYHCATDPQRLAVDRDELMLMCRAITQGFAALRNQHVRGLPRNLAVLHNRVMRPVAVRYWARSMRSPLGELAFAAHSRHAEAEMHAIAADVLARFAGENTVPAVRELLSPRMT